MTAPVIDRLICAHGMGSPAACIECMDEGKTLPKSARRARSGQAAAASGYAYDNDCSVQAVARAVGADYEEAAVALRAAGWVPGNGASASKVIEAVESLGFKARKVPYTARPSGTYIICGWVSSHRGHAWTSVDGELFDAFGWPARIRRVLMLEITA